MLVHIFLEKNNKCLRVEDHIIVFCIFITEHRLIQGTHRWPESVTEVFCRNTYYCILPSSTGIDTILWSVMVRCSPCWRRTRCFSRVFPRSPEAYIQQTPPPSELFNRGPKQKWPGVLERAEPPWAPLWLCHRPTPWVITAHLSGIILSPDSSQQPHCCVICFWGCWLILSPGMEPGT